MSAHPSIPDLSSSRALRRRRNGRAPACRECHRRKLACDHGLPSCRRCCDKGISQHCVYDTSPSRPKSSNRGPVANDSTRKGDNDPGLNAVAITPPPGAHGSSSASSSRGHGQSPPGYLGPTSFLPVFEEAQLHLAAATSAAAADEYPHLSTPQQREPAPGRMQHEDQQAGSNSKLLLGKCVHLLSAIPSHETSIALFEAHINPNEAWIRLACRRLIDSLWDTFGAELRGVRRATTDLERMAARIVENTSRKLREDDDEEDGDPDAWFASFSGPRLRWEAVGILFIMWCFGAIASFKRGPCTATGGVEPRALMFALRDCAGLCIDMCRRMSCENTLMVYLLYRFSILETHISGDASSEAWRLHSECVALTTFLGLHCIPDDAHYRPSVGSQVKRRLCANVFYIDKTLATFTGRPPLLGGRYIRTPMPLDVSEEVLLGPREALVEAACAMATGDPLNYEREIRSVTMLRARTKFAYIRDGVLDLALAAQPIEINQTLRDLDCRQNEAFSDLPAVLVYRPSDVADDALSTRTVYSRVLVRLEHLQNLFFIQRLSDKRGEANRAQLLRISQEMVSLTLLFWTHRERFAGLHGDNEWLVMSYAAPAGGVLCLELLHPSEASSDVESNAPSKSDIIQHLSLLSGFLSWVEPSAPNGDLCQKVKKVIKHVLDQVLSAPAATPSGPATMLMYILTWATCSTSTFWTRLNG